MDFLALQNDVLSDRFSESKRANAKNWINYRYGRLWAAEDWTFKYALVSYNVALGASTIPLGTIQRPIALWDTTTSPSYTPIESSRPEIFYNDASTASSVPVGFTVVGSNIILNQPVSGARTYQVLGELGFVALAADGDTPLIPSEFHLILSHGATAEGLKDENDPSWQGKEADYDSAYQDLKKGYLVNVRTYGGSYPAWSPQV
jgi:hypothetical protein